MRSGALWTSDRTDAVQVPLPRAQRRNTMLGKRVCSKNKSLCIEVLLVECMYM